MYDITSLEVRADLFSRKHTGAIVFFSSHLVRLNYNIKIRQMAKPEMLQTSNADLSIQTPTRVWYHIGGVCFVSMYV